MYLGRHGRKDTSSAMYMVITMARPHFEQSEMLNRTTLERKAHTRTDMYD